MKYGTWNISSLNREMTLGLIDAGISPLVAAVLVSRGFNTPEKAREFLAAGSGPLSDPMTLPDMAKAAQRVRLALQRGETIAVYGDYDVDGITATCLLTDFLTKHGAKNCLWYIPARLEEGYGLNEPAIRRLRDAGTNLIITVDCGITAVEEAELCKKLSIDLIVTDHHVCREVLPDAVAVVDPHRPDAVCPNRDLAGVGVAFKLAAAICGDQQAVFDAYCDFVAMGTIADVMPLMGENRVLTIAGIEAIRQRPRPGVRALLEACQQQPDRVTSATLGYTLAPRINAAGRTGQVELAAELFLTDDPDYAAVLSRRLCDLNRQRQAIEAQIYDEAKAMLQGVTAPDAIVLAKEGWHQGVVGIVVSRLAEEYSCPVFLISLSGEIGKASSRSSGDFPLFSALRELSDLLLNFGGHELAAGFTIHRDRISAFRDAVTRLAREYHLSHPEGKALELDCTVPPELLTLENIEALSCLEPFGSGFPRPVLHMAGLRIDYLSEFSGGRHLRLHLTKNAQHLDAVFFSSNARTAAVASGDNVELAFIPQINEFHGTRNVQLNLTDIRLSAEYRRRIERDLQIYMRLRNGSLSAEEAVGLIPQRREFAEIWRYLSANGAEECLTEEVHVLSRKIARSAGRPVSFVRTRLCLDVLQERGLIRIDTGPAANTLLIRLTPGPTKVNLQESEILLRLKNLQG